MSNPTSSTPSQLPDKLQDVVAMILAFAAQSVLAYFGIQQFMSAVAFLLDIWKPLLFCALSILGLVLVFLLNKIFQLLGATPQRKQTGRNLVYVLCISALLYWRIVNLPWCGSIYPSFTIINNPRGIVVDEEGWNVTVPAGTSLLIEFSAKSNPVNLACAFQASGEEVFEIDPQQRCQVTYRVGASDSALRASIWRLGCSDRENPKTLTIRSRER